MIELDDVTVGFGDVRAVDGVCLDVARGELVALVGPSGCGKTTTLKSVNRLVEISSGMVRVAGRDIRSELPFELRRRVGYGFQEVGLFPHMTVRENIGVTPSLLGWDGARLTTRVDELMELVELAPELGSRMPAELSGGQAQRVGVARALAAEPEVLLLDEPFGALDPLTRDRLQQSFDRLRRNLQLTVLFVTHDMAEAMLLADRIAVMRGGRVHQLDTPRDLLLRPADPFVEELVATPLRHAATIDRLVEPEGSR